MRPATAARRAHILEAALACFNERGIDATTIHDIQGAADCSIGSLYHHFGSKEGIAEELFIALITQFNDARLASLQDCTNGEESVRALVEEYCRWSTDNPGYAHFLHARDIDFSPAAKARLKALHDDYLNTVFAWFEPFLRSGQIREYPVDVYVSLISGPVRDYVGRWLSEQLSQSPMTVAEVFAGAAWESVRTH